MKTKKNNSAFENQMLRDEIEFRKTVFKTEHEDLRTRFKGLETNAKLDLNFYTTELQKAISQIKQDFESLTQKQIDDLRKSKENELAIRNQEYEYEKQLTEMAVRKAQAEQALELNNAQQLKKNFSQNKKEMEQLNVKYGEMVNKLQRLEVKLVENRDRNFHLMNQKLDEIDLLSEENQVLVDELAGWEQDTRAKQEAEIQTYKSLLESQLKHICSVGKVNTANGYVLMDSEREKAIESNCFFFI
jgi:hypothetical protein